MRPNRTTSVSVALCTHNGARYVGEQVASILGQDRMPDEIVLSDDASTDDTVAIVRRLLADATEAPRLRVLENDRALGVVANFEQAVRACSGELIALCDQDDRWHPDRISRALAEFDRDPGLVLLFSDAVLVDGAGVALPGTLLDSLEVGSTERDAIHRGAAFDALIRRNLVTGATAMFRRELLEVAVPFASAWVHDEWLAILGAATARIDLIEATLIDYRQHGQNQIGVARPTLRRKIGRTLQARGERNDRLALASAQLVERLRALPAVRPGLATIAQEKADFEASRAALPRSRAKRIGPVVRALRAGRYDRYASRGRLDVLRDLLQSHS